VKRIAYLVSDYDAPSHTFVRREVAALRALGRDIVTFSIRRTCQADADATSILGQPTSVFAWSLIASVAKRPIRFLTTWSLAVQHRPPGLRALLWAHFHLIEALVLSHCLTKLQVAHLHVHFANSGATVAMLAARYSAINWSMTLHGISETDYPAGLLLADKITRAQFVACASYFMKAQAMRQVPPAYWRKFRVIRCGVDSKLLSTMIDRLQQSRVPKLICVGRLSPEKGHLNLIEAISNLRLKGVHCELTLVGDGPFRGIIEETISTLHLQNYVTLHGFLNEVDTLQAIASSDILVLPSFMEGLPVVLIEALGMAKPVLASRVAGIPELIEDGKTGLLFTPADTESLENRLHDLVSDRRRWNEFGAAGKAKVAEEFDSLQIAKQIQELFP